MENKRINIAEILKDCPRGMELYSPLCGTCVFDSINMGTIICKKQNTQEITFTSEGYYMLPVFDNCECMLFPSKDQRDWSKFQRLFKDGDIVACNQVGNKNPTIYIYYHDEAKRSMYYIALIGGNKLKIDKGILFLINENAIRFATEEEKQKLLKVIEENGYKWNEETKTLEKLIEPKFKVGDRIKSTFTEEIHIIEHITENGYFFKNGGGLGFSFKNEDKYELMPNKFDISTLVPFESKVLVRDYRDQKWKPAVFGDYDTTDNIGCPYIVVGGNAYAHLIPYENNEHLLGTIEECADFYKNWKE